MTFYLHHHRQKKRNGGRAKESVYRSSCLFFILVINEHFFSHSRNVHEGYDTGYKKKQSTRFLVDGVKFPLHCFAEYVRELLLLCRINYLHVYTYTKAPGVKTKRISRGSNREKKHMCVIYKTGEKGRSRKEILAWCVLLCAFPSIPSLTHSLLIFRCWHRKFEIYIHSCHRGERKKEAWILGLKHTGYLFFGFLSTLRFFSCNQGKKSDGTKKRNLKSENSNRICVPLKPLEKYSWIYIYYFLFFANFRIRFHQYFFFFFF